MSLGDTYFKERHGREPLEPLVDNIYIYVWNQYYMTMVNRQNTLQWIGHSCKLEVNTKNNTSFIFFPFKYNNPPVWKITLTWKKYFHHFLQWFRFLLEIVTKAKLIKTSEEWSQVNRLVSELLYTCSRLVRPWTYFSLHEV